MAATPNDLAYFDRGELLRSASGVSSTTGFDYFDRNEPNNVAIVISSPGGGSSVPALMYHYRRRRA